ncbi:hypothetical protein L1987_11843 [Smallanthus sonchifolius]|uniref:Uncharacterized protein n=1 Tax=Smallanthus sonchifolius TaxID=185202 RepID=A0ACB9JED7_9ASTR|nr:hypothetical protein L1987_11843 [Smallanthus sonchifolius]
MEVKPVVAVVTQKLADTLNEESIADNKVMIHQLKGVQRSLLKLQSFSDQQDVYVSDVSQKSKDRLHVLYHVEDEIEKFTFQVARQRKRYGFLMKQAFFFNNLNSCRRLKRKIKKIQSTISSSPEYYSTSSTTPSSNTTSSLDSVNSHHHDHDLEHDGDGDGDDFNYGAIELTQKSSSAVWPVAEIPDTPSPKRVLERSFSTIPHHQEHMQQQKKLTFRYSYNEDEMNIVGFNIQYPRQLSSFCYQEEELGVFGLNDDIKSLMKRLTHQTKLLVPIVGEVGKSQSVLLDWIVKLVNLQSLRLTSVDDMGHPSKLVLKPLTSLNNLSHLNLYGCLERLPAVNEFPPTVKVLTLSISKLDKDPMETLEQLPCLIVLRLLGESFTGRKMVCHRGGFKKLGVLKLWLLKDLEEWDVEEEAMESLKELEIRRCHKLSNIPCRILQKQRCLEEIVLTDMPDEFVTGIKKRKSKDTSLTINPWKST